MRLMLILLFGFLNPIYSQKALLGKWRFVSIVYTNAGEQKVNEEKVPSEFNADKSSVCFNEDGSLAVLTPCNTYGFNWSTKNINQLKLKDSGGTLMACAPESQNAIWENIMHGSLLNAQKWELVTEGLKIYYKNELKEGAMLFVR